MLYDVVTQVGYCFWWSCEWQCEIVAFKLMCLMNSVTTFLPLCLPYIGNEQFAQFGVQIHTVNFTVTTDSIVGKWEHLRKLLASKYHLANALWWYNSIIAVFFVYWLAQRFVQIWIALFYSSPIFPACFILTNIFVD